MAITKIVDVGTADAVWFKYLLSCVAASCAEFGKLGSSDLHIFRAILSPSTQRLLC